jgi:MFS family permease
MRSSGEHPPGGPGGVDGAARGARRAGMFASLVVRDFRFLWAGGLCSSFAMNVQMVARGYLIYEMSHSATQLAWVTLAFMLPQVLFSLVGGVLADRLPKKTLMIGAQSLNCAAALLMATIIFTEAVTFWHFIWLGVFNGTLLALSMPSRQSIIPEVIGPDQLMNAIALNSASMNLSRILGPALSGGLIALFHTHGEIPYVGVGLVYLIIALLYAGAATSVRFVRISGRPQHASTNGVWRDISEGFAYVRDTRLMFGLVIMGTFPMMFGMPMQNLMPAFSRSVLHGGPEDLGLLMTSLGVGAIAGTLALAHAGDFAAKGRALFLGCAAWGFFIFLFTFADAFGAAVVLTAFAGIFSSALMALNRTMMQLEAPPAMRGRIMSFDQMAHGLMPVGILPIGYLSDVIGVQHALQVSAGVLLALTAVAYWRLPEVWNFGLESSAR